MCPSMDCVVGRPTVMGNWSWTGGLSSLLLWSLPGHRADASTEGAQIWPSNPGVWLKPDTAEDLGELSGRAQGLPFSVHTRLQLLAQGCRWCLGPEKAADVLVMPPCPQSLITAGLSAGHSYQLGNRDQMPTCQPLGREVFSCPRHCCSSEMSTLAVTQPNPYQLSGYRHMPVCSYITVCSQRNS